MVAAMQTLDEIFIESYDTFQDQSIRNRFYIAHSNGVQLISLPVKHPTKVLYNEIVLAEDVQSQVPKIEQALKSAYGKAVYYEHYWPSLIEPWLQKMAKKSSLWSLNVEMLPLWLKAVKISSSIKMSDGYHKTLQNELDWRNSFGKRTCTVAEMQDVVYHQTFGNEFERDLSIIDLLFNEGPNAIKILAEMNKNIV
jgi:hypothetical protein